MLQEWISWGGSMKWVKTKWPVAGISLKSVNSGSLLPRVVGDQLPRLEMLMTEWHCSDLEVPLRPRRRLTLFFYPTQPGSMEPMWEKIVSFSLLDATHGFSPPQRKYPHTHLKKTSLSQWKIGQLDFKIFTFPLLIKKKTKTKFFFFMFLDIFFFQIATSPYLYKIACMRAGTMSIRSFFYL